MRTRDGGLPGWRASRPALGGCGGDAPVPAVRRAAADVLTIGAYSVVREAFHEASCPRSPRVEGEDRARRRFEESYNASGAQSRAIASGFDADVAVLSLEGDMNALVKAGLVKTDWNAGPNKGMITRSLVVIGVPRRATRRGSATGPTWRGPASACSTPTRRPPAAPAGTSTRSTARASAEGERGRARPGGRARPAGRGCRRTS